MILDLVFAQFRGTNRELAPHRHASPEAIMSHGAVVRNEHTMSTHPRSWLQKVKIDIANPQVSGMLMEPVRGLEPLTARLQVGYSGVSMCSRVMPDAHSSTWRPVLLLSRFPGVPQRAAASAHTMSTHGSGRRRPPSRDGHRDISFTLVAVSSHPGLTGGVHAVYDGTSPRSRRLQVRVGRRRVEPARAGRPADALVGRQADDGQRLVTGVAPSCSRPRPLARRSGSTSISTCTARSPG